MLAPFCFMAVERQSPCKINLLLNVLDRRTDGFHDLETVLHPIGVCDELSLARRPAGIALRCSEPTLPVDNRNLVWRAAEAFLQAAHIKEGVHIALQKRIPVAAGLGGGSSNAANTLLGLNELFGHPLSSAALTSLAAGLGSDVPFFLQPQPALATGRGEHLEVLDFFPALRDVFALLVYPGFGVPTAWAYQRLAAFPGQWKGDPGRGRRLITLLEAGDLAQAVSGFHNTLELPVLRKYPILELFQEFLRAHGAVATLMSGSGSTTFALVRNRSDAEGLSERFVEKFGNCWTSIIAL